MFVFTFRKGGLRRLAAVCLCGAAIVGAAAAGIAWNRAQSTPANAALTQQITGSQDIASFLAGYGVEVDPTSADTLPFSIACATFECLFPNMILRPFYKK